MERGRKNGPTRTIFNGIHLWAKRHRCTKFHHVPKIVASRLNTRQQQGQTGAQVYIEPKNDFESIGLIKRGSTSRISGCCTNSQKLNIALYRTWGCREQNERSKTSYY